MADPVFCLAAADEELLAVAQVIARWSTDGEDEVADIARRLREARSIIKAVASELPQSERAAFLPPVPAAEQAVSDALNEVYERLRGLGRSFCPYRAEEHADHAAGWRRGVGDAIDVLAEFAATPPDASQPPAGGEGRELRGAELIAAERRRQVQCEGWTPEHDDSHRDGELRRAAIAYATYPGSGHPGAWGYEQGEPYTPSPWPFEQAAWKPSVDPVRDLVRAGALIAAEIDRLLRVRELPAGGTASLGIGERVPAGVDSWARHLTCGGYLRKAGERDDEIVTVCEQCGETESLYKRRRVSAGESAAREASSAPITLDRDWTDDDDEPLGGWVQIDADEWQQIVTEAGGLRALTVFSTLTDPDGQYGSPQTYTAWGNRDAEHPLVDIRDYKEDGRTSESILRKFVPSKPGEGARS